MVPEAGLFGAPDQKAPFKVNWKSRDVMSKSKVILSDPGSTAQEEWTGLAYHVSLDQCPVQRGRQGNLFLRIVANDSLRVHALDEGIEFGSTWPIESAQSRVWAQIKQSALHVA